MPSQTQLTPEKAAEAQALAEAIRLAITTEIEELAATLINTDDQHLFGQNEFKLRDLAHKIAAKALEQRLAKKKRLFRIQRDVSSLWPGCGIPQPPPAYPYQSDRSRLLPPSLLPVPQLRPGPVPL